MKRRGVSLFLVLILCMVSLSGCKKNDSGEKLYVYNWTEYIPQEVYDAFEEQTGIHVVESTFSSNEEMLAKLTAGGTGQYDLVIASNYVVKAMVEQELIQPIHKENLKNLGNISPSSLGQSYDPDNTYTIPFMSTITVIAVNREKCKELGVTITKFEDLLNPALENNIVVVDDVREIVGIALKARDRIPILQTRKRLRQRFPGCRNSSPTSRPTTATAPRPFWRPMMWQWELFTIQTQGWLSKKTLILMWCLPRSPVRFPWTILYSPPAQPMWKMRRNSLILSISRRYIK